MSGEHKVVHVTLIMNDNLLSIIETCVAVSTINKGRYSNGNKEESVMVEFHIPNNDEQPSVLFYGRGYAARAFSRLSLRTILRRAVDVTMMYCAPSPESTAELLIVPLISANGIRERADVKYVFGEIDDDDISAFRSSFEPISKVLGVGECVVRYTDGSSERGRDVLTRKREGCDRIRRVHVTYTLSKNDCIDLRPLADIDSFWTFDLHPGDRAIKFSSNTAISKRRRKE